MGLHLVSFFQITGLSAGQQAVEDHFHAAGDGVEVDLHIHLIATDDIVFNGVHARKVEDNAVFEGANHSQNPCQVEGAIGDTSIVGIAKQIIHAVCINLATNQLDYLLVRVGLIDDTRDLSRKFWTKLEQDLMNFSFRRGDNTLSNLLMVGMEDPFEGMGEGTVANIME